MLGQSRVAWLIPLAAFVVAREALVPPRGPTANSEEEPRLWYDLLREDLQVVEPRRFEGVSISNGCRTGLERSSVPQFLARRRRVHGVIAL